MISDAQSSSQFDNRERLIQQALFESARNLSADERYVMYRLIAQIASRTETVHRLGGLVVCVAVEEFARLASVTQKVAERRLRVAGNKLMARWVSVRNQHDEGFDLAWVQGTYFDGELLEFRFTAKLIDYIVAAQSRAGIQITPPLLAFGSAITASVKCAQGEKVPVGLPVERVSRLQARKKRPKVMGWKRLVIRLIKRLEKKTPMTLDLKDQLICAIEDIAPWFALCRREGHGFTSHDLDRLYDFVLSKADDPEFLKG